MINHLHSCSTSNEIDVSFFNVVSFAFGSEFSSSNQLILCDPFTYNWRYCQGLES